MVGSVGGEGAEGEEQKGKGKGGRGAFTSMIAFCDVGEDPRGGKCKDILYTKHFPPPTLLL